VLLLSAADIATTCRRSSAAIAIHRRMQEGLEPPSGANNTLINVPLGSFSVRPTGA